MKKKIRYRVLLKTAGIGLVLSAVVFFYNGCTKQYTNQPVPNKLPKTFFWVYSDTAVATGISKQEIRWWGEDPDGYVVGYLLAVVPNLTVLPSPDTLTYTFTTTMDSIISFPLRQAKQTFLIAVHAIDNTYRGPLTNGAKVKLYPFPYWHKNDTTDVQLNDLVNSMDVSGAKQQFPTVNTPPSIDYVPDLADNSVVAQPPPTTFTVAGFSWVGHDFDGDETIASYRLSLNDSTFVHPMVIPYYITTVTLSVPRGRSDTAALHSSNVVNADVIVGRSPNVKVIGTLPGLQLDANNALYIQAVDVAGAVSKFIPFPTTGRSWYVTRPRGKVLIINDYVENPSIQVVRPFYTDSVFTKMGVLFDILDIRSGSTSTRYGSTVPAGQHLNPVLIKTFKLYDCVFWYADGSPSLDVARTVLYYYWALEGGHLVYSAYFSTPNDVPDAKHAYRDFVPLDTLNSPALVNVNGSPVTRFHNGVLIRPDSSISADIYPVMRFKGDAANPNFAAGFTIYPMVPNAAARNIYYLTADTLVARYPLASVGVVDETKHVIFFNIPLHKLAATEPIDGLGHDQGVVGFFKKAFTVFGIQ